MLFNQKEVCTCMPSVDLAVEKSSEVINLFLHAWRECMGGKYVRVTNIIAFQTKNTLLIFSNCVFH